MGARESTDQYGTNNTITTLMTALSANFEEKINNRDEEEEKVIETSDEKTAERFSCPIFRSVKCRPIFWSVKCGFNVHPEYPQLLVTLLMQDGPFLVLRLVLSVQFDVSTELHLFFLCKNALVCILLLQRLVILTLEKGRLAGGVEFADQQTGGGNDVVIYVNDNVSSNRSSMRIDNYRLSTFL